MCDTIYRMSILVILFLSTISTLAIIHFVALEFYLYWMYFWFDMLMHFLGGISVAFGVSTLPFFNINIPQRFNNLGTYILVVLIVGILWEVFELANGISIVGDDNFVLDTFTDLLFGIIGGTFGYYIVTRIKNF